MCVCDLKVQKRLQVLLKLTRLPKEFCFLLSLTGFSLAAKDDYQAYGCVHFESIINVTHLKASLKCVKIASGDQMALSTSETCYIRFCMIKMLGREASFSESRTS